MGVTGAASGAHITRTHHATLGRCASCRRMNRSACEPRCCGMCTTIQHARRGGDCRRPAKRVLERHWPCCPPVAAGHSPACQHRTSPGFKDNSSSCNRRACVALVLLLARAGARCLRRAGGQTAGRRAQSLRLVHGACEIDTSSPARSTPMGLGTCRPGLHDQLHPGPVHARLWHPLSRHIALRHRLLIGTSIGRGAGSQTRGFLQRANSGGLPQSQRL